MPTDYDVLEDSEFSGNPCELYLFTRGTEVYAFVDDDTQTHLGVTYQAANVSMSSPEQSQEINQTRITVTVDHDNPVAALFKQAVPSKPVGLIVYRYHYKDDGTISTIYAYWSGRVINCNTRGENAELDCEPLLNILKQPGLYKPDGTGCNHVIYDSGCTLNRDLFKVSAIVTAMSENGVVIGAANFATKPDGWFTAGLCERLLIDESRTVINHIGTDVTLLMPFDGLTVGETVWIYAGCARDFITCDDKFDNTDNYGGEPDVPVDNVFETGLK